MVQAVVTGVAGFIGSHQAEFLLEKGHEVVGIDNFHPYYSEDIKRQNLEQVRQTAEDSSGRFRFVEGSILEEDDLDRLPDKPRWVFHLAALAGTRSSLDNPAEYSKINVHGTSRLIQSFESLGKLVFTSSSSVYGEVAEEELPVKEDRALDPKTPYSLSKHHAERLIKLQSRLYGFDYAIVRPFTVYGARQRPDEIFTKFTARMLDGRPIEIYGDGDQSRDFTNVKDVVRGTYLAAEKGEGVYNLGSQRRVTVNEIIDVLDGLVDREVERRHVDEHEGDVSHTHADISRAEKELGYSPEVDIEDGARRCVSWVEQLRERDLL